LKTIHGNTVGLKPRQRRDMERLYERRIDQDAVVVPLVANRMIALSLETDRQVGILVDRAGRITHVIVGDASRVWIPDLGRERAGRSRLRGLRLVHTHPGGELLDLDDMLDLTRLRLDLVAALIPDATRTNPHVNAIYPVYAPGTPDPYEKIGPTPLSALDLDFQDMVASLEEELRRARREMPAGKDGRAILVGASTRRSGAGEAGLDELDSLSRSAGVSVSRRIHQRRSKLDPNTIVGKGKLLEIITHSITDDSDVLIFDHDLNPKQARAISAFTDMRVIDRSQLILDIFAQRARTSEGQLQVELAQLKYMMPRLVERDDALSRLTGGIGGRGPGETKLEIGRRRVRERVARLENRIDKLSRQRRQRRKRRQRSGLPLAALVGYTNAGKSTLLNTLTGSSVPAEDRLFATLDPTTRRLRLASGRTLVLADTVGFIRKLPPTLVSAFRATLEEISDAAAIIHLLDASDPEADTHLATVEGILGDMGLGSIPRIVGVNKRDRADPDVLDRLVALTGGVALSSHNREGASPLLERIDELLGRLVSASPPPS
jgi:GTP-binding protein HflX